MLKVYILTVIDDLTNCNEHSFTYTATLTTVITLRLIIINFVVKQRMILLVYICCNLEQLFSSIFKFFCNVMQQKYAALNCANHCSLPPRL